MTENSNGQQERKHTIFSSAVNSVTLKGQNYRSVSSVFSFASFHPRFHQDFTSLGPSYTVLQTQTRPKKRVSAISAVFTQWQNEVLCILPSDNDIHFAGH